MTDPKSPPPCKWEITSRPVHQCHEGGPCPHLDDPGFQCECLPRARALEARIVEHIESGDAARQVNAAIKNVGKVA